VLRSADAAVFAAAIEKGMAWLRAVNIETVLDAAGALLGLDPADRAATAQRQHCLDVITRGQAPNGGWGPYVTSPPDVFDTALVMLALQEASPADFAIALQRARAFLIEQQLDDGSWPETTRPANQESYAQRISTTGWALLALLETR
jgi:squalene-hopene cyclase-like protein